MFVLLSKRMQFNNTERRHLNTSSSKTTVRFSPLDLVPLSFLEFTWKFRILKLSPSRLPIPCSLPLRFPTAPSLLWKLCSLCGRTERGHRKREKKVSPVSSELPLISFDFLGERERAPPCQSDTQRRDGLWSDSHLTYAAFHFVTLSISSLFSIPLGSPELYNLECHILNFSYSVAACDPRWNYDAGSVQVHRPCLKRKLLQIKAAFSGSNVR